MLVHAGYGGTASVFEVRIRHLRLLDRSVTNQRNQRQRNQPYQP
jgi:hypothetical protein